MKKNTINKTLKAKFYKINKKFVFQSEGKFGMFSTIYINENYTISIPTIYEDKYNKNNAVIRIKEERADGAPKTYNLFDLRDKSNHTFSVENLIKMIEDASSNFEKGKQLIFN